MAILTGSLFAGDNPESIYKVTGAILILEILFVFMLNPYTNEKNNRNPIAKHSIDGSRSSFIIVIMMLGLALVFSGDSATNSFRYTILTSLGGSISVFSTLTAYKGLMEIPIMFLYPQLRKIGSGKLLTISVFFFLIKLILTRLASSVNLLYVALLFQSLSFGLYTPAIVHFIGQHVQPEHAASAQSLGSGMNTFGAFSATILTGYILSSRSVQYSLNVLLIIEIVGFSLYIFSRFNIRDSS
jgi:PPP family 3-phenylpropionic acid transporter